MTKDRALKMVKTITNEPYECPGCKNMTQDLWINPLADNGKWYCESCYRGHAFLDVARTLFGAELGGVIEHDKT